MEGVENLSPEERGEALALMESERKRVRKMAMTMSNPTFAITIFRSVHQQIDAVVESVVRNRPPGYFACRAGCSYCCKIRVSAFPAEVFGIARSVEKFDTPCRKALMERLETHAALVHGAVADDFSSQCPLLENDLCSVYEARPQACRTHMSLDVEACKDESVPTIPKDAMLSLKGAALTMGAKEGLSKYKQSNESAELGQCVLATLKDKTLEQRWFKGADVFAPFRGPDD